MNTSLYDQHKAMTETVPIPTLAETPAILRDRAIGEANELRQREAEFIAVLRLVEPLLTGFAEGDDAMREDDEEPIVRPVLEKVRALLAKVSK